MEDESRPIECETNAENKNNARTICWLLENCVALADRCMHIYKDTNNKCVQVHKHTHTHTLVQNAHNLHNLPVDLWIEHV